MRRMIPTLKRKTLRNLPQSSDANEDEDEDSKKKKKKHKYKKSKAKATAKKKESSEGDSKIEKLIKEHLKNLIVSTKKERTPCKYCSKTTMMSINIGIIPTMGERYPTHASNQCYSSTNYEPVQHKIKDTTIQERNTIRHRKQGPMSTNLAHIME